MDTDDFWTSLSQSEALETVLVNGEGSDAMKDSSVSEESIEALEEWLKKNGTNLVVQTIFFCCETFI